MSMLIREDTKTFKYILRCKLYDSCLQFTFNPIIYTRGIANFGLGGPSSIAQIARAYFITRVLRENPPIIGAPKFVGKFPIRKDLEIMDYNG